MLYEYYNGEYVPINLIEQIYYEEKMNYEYLCKVSDTCGIRIDGIPYHGDKNNEKDTQPAQTFVPKIIDNVLTHEYEEKEKETMIWLCGMDEYDGFGDKIRNIYNEAIKNTSQDFIQKYLPRIMKECEDAASKAVDYARIDLDPYIEEYIECELCNSEFNRVELRKNVLVFMKSFCEKNKLQFEETDHHYNYEAYEDFTISWNKEEEGE